MQTPIVAIVSGSQATVEPPRRMTEGETPDAATFEDVFEESLLEVEIPADAEGELLEGELAEETTEGTDAVVFAEPDEEFTAEVVETADFDVDPLPLKSDDGDLTVEDADSGEPAPEVSKIEQPPSVHESAMMQQTVQSKAAETQTPVATEKRAVNAPVTQPAEAPTLPKPAQQPNVVPIPQADDAELPARVTQEPQVVSPRQMPVERIVQDVLQPLPAQPRPVAQTPLTQAKPVQPAQFALQVLPADEGAPRIELSWPSAPEARTAPQVVQTVVAPTIVQAARPEIVKIAQSLLAEKDVAVSGEPLRNDPALSLPSGFGAPRDVQQAIAQVANVAATRADLPANVARQLSETMARSVGKSVEIALHPAELGRVRMTLSPAETGMVVMVQADRPDTIELIRRNIDMLDSALGGLGYDDVTFSFGDTSGSDSDQPHEQTQAGPDSGQIEVTEINVTQEHIRTPKVAGLDIRV